MSYSQLSPKAQRLLLVARAFTTKALTYQQALAIIELKLREEFNERERGLQKKGERTLVIICTIANQKKHKSNSMSNEG